MMYIYTIYVNLYDIYTIYVIFRYLCILYIFIHSSINGHLGCFHILAIVNNTIINRYLFEILPSFPLDK